MKMTQVIIRSGRACDALDRVMAGRAVGHLFRARQDHVDRAFSSATNDKLLKVKRVTHVWECDLIGEIAHFP